VPLDGRRNRARPPVLPIPLISQDVTDQNVPRERRESTRLPWQASAETPCREGESRRNCVRPLTATSPERAHERHGLWARRQLLLRRAARWPQIECFGPACEPMEPVRFHLGHRQRARALTHQDVVALLKRLLASPAGQRVAYLSPADNAHGSLLGRLRGAAQPIVKPCNAFSAPRLPLLTRVETAPPAPLPPHLPAQPVTGPAGAAMAAPGSGAHLGATTRGPSPPPPAPVCTAATAAPSHHRW
jgi:hypothetical protein